MTHTSFNIKLLIMKKIVIVIEKSKDFFDGYAENCDGIYGAGDSIQAVKDDIAEAIRLLKENCPADKWPDELKGEYQLEYKLDVQSFLEYYSSFLSLSGMEKITGVNQKQLSNYLNNRSKPRKQQAERICKGLHSFARELLMVTL